MATFLDLSRKQRDKINEYIDEYIDGIITRAELHHRVIGEFLEQDHNVTLSEALSAAQGILGKP